MRKVSARRWASSDEAPPLDDADAPGWVRRAHERETGIRAEVASDAKETEESSEEKLKSAQLDYDYKVKHHYSHPWYKHPDETPEDHERRRDLYRKYGMWPTYGEQEDDPSYVQRRSGEQVKNVARAAKELRVARDRDIEKTVQAGTMALVQAGTEQPATMSTPDLAHQVARLALFVAAAKMADADASKAMAGAERAIRIKQLLTGDPTNIVGFSSSERANKLVEIARQLEAMEDGTIECEFTGRRAQDTGGQSPPDQTPA